MRKNGLYLLSLIIITSIISACSGTKKLASVSSFDMEQTSMIMAADSLAPMRVFKINNYSDSILLRKQCSEVDVRSDDPILNRFVKRLYATVRDSMSMGVGIAAPQVGILKNIIWVQRFDKKDFPFEVYINPKISSYSKLKQDCREGCLSIPDRSDTTRTRSYAIMIDYDKMDGSHHTEMIEDFTAVIFQHEIDHLNGILYLDHLEKEVKAAERTGK
jgi:peptide deformylase